MPGRLTDDVAWELLTTSHTGVFTTLRRDGMPMSFPVWFAVVDRTICVSTRPMQKKVARVRHDPRASFVVESGKRADDLRGVHLTGRVEFVEDPGELKLVAAALEAKYEGYRIPEEGMADSFRRATTGRTLLRLRPDAKMLSWDFSQGYAQR